MPAINSDSPASPFLTVAEACIYTRRHKNTVSNALRAGDLPGRQAVPNGKWLIHRDDLDAWLRGDTTASQTRVPA